MNNWIMRRSFLGLLSIIIEALNTMRALVHDDCDPQLYVVAEAVYQVQLMIAKLQDEINKLPAN